MIKNKEEYKVALKKLIKWSRRDDITLTTEKGMELNKLIDDVQAYERKVCPI